MSNELEVNEDVVGFYQIPNINADTIVATIKDTLLRFDLSIFRCRGQCYDGAANMSGHRNGVKSQLLNEEKVHTLLLTCFESVCIRHH